MPNGDKLTPQQFASKIKEKYPQYKDIADDELVTKITAKYPQYKDTIDFAGGTQQLHSPQLQVDSSPTITTPVRFNNVGESTGVHGMPMAQQPQENNEQTQQLQKQQQEKRNMAVKNTVTRKFDKAGLTLKDNPLFFKQEYDKLKQKEINGDLVVVNDKFGQPALTRREGHIETLFNTLGNSFKSTVTAFKVNSIDDPKKLSNYFEQKRIEEPVVPESAPGNNSYVEELVGGAVKPIGLSAIPYVGRGIATLEAQHTSEAAQRENMYFTKKNELIKQGVPEDEARLQAGKVAIDNAWEASIPDAVTMYALSGNVAGGAAKPALQTFRKALAGTVKQSAKMGAIGATAEVAKAAVEKNAGLDVSLQDAINRGVKGFGDWAMMDLAFKAITNPLSVPKHITAAAKEVFRKSPPEVRDAYIESAGEDAPKVAEELNNYNQAASKVQNFVPEEHVSTFAGLVEKKDNLKKKLEQDLNYTDPTFHEDLQKEYDNQISAIDNQIKKLKKSDSPISEEIDDATGESANEAAEIKSQNIKEDATARPQEENKKVETEITSTETNAGGNGDNESQRTVETSIANTPIEKGSTITGGIEAAKKDIEKRRQEDLNREIRLSGYKGKNKYVGGNDVLGSSHEEVRQKINSEYDKELSDLENKSPTAGSESNPQQKVELAKVKDEINDTPLLKDAKTGVISYIPKSIVEKAYENDSANNGKVGGRVIQTVDIIIQRGGYDAREMDTLYPNWRKEVAELNKPKSESNTQPKEVGGVSSKGEVDVKEPSSEQQMKDVKDGNLVTFTYKSEAEVPEIFKDKISSKGTTNGETIVRVTIPKSLADYHLAKADIKPTTEPTVQATPTEVKDNTVPTSKKTKSEGNSVVEPIVSKSDGRGVVKESSIDRSIREAKEAAQANDVAQSQIDVLINSVKPELKDFVSQLKYWYLDEGKKPDLDTQDKKDIFYITKLMFSGWPPKEINEQIKQHVKAVNFYDNRNTTPTEFIAKLLEPIEKKAALPAIENNSVVDNPESKTGSKEDVPIVSENKKMSFEDFKKEALDMAVNMSDSSFDWRLHIPDMSQEQRDGAVKDIRAGKETTPRAKKLLDALQTMHDNGIVSVNRGRGKMAETVDIPLNEWFQHPLDAKELEASKNIDEETLQIIEREGITLDNIDNLKHLFDGFPYDKTDLQNVKDNLSKTSSSDAETKPISEEKPPSKTSQEVADNTIVSEKTDLGTKAREYAAKLKSGEANLLPSWMRADLPEGTKKSGLDVNEAFAKALETFADIHDATKDFAKAVEAGFKHIKDYFDDNKIPYNEKELKTNFEGELSGEKSNQEPPPPPIGKEGEGMSEGGDSEWTAIRKEKLKEIDSVRKIFEKETGKTWNEIQQQALEGVQKEYPDKTLYEAVKAKTEELAAKYDNKIDYNPTAKDLAVIQEYRRQIQKKINSSEDRINSDDDIIRKAAMLEVEGYQYGLENAAKALHTREAGTAFGFRQSESKMDENYGLQIRRMELMRAQGGEPLTAEQTNATQELWEQEKALMHEKNQLREKGLREDFENRISKLKQEYEAQIKKQSSTPSGRKYTSDKLRSFAQKIKSSETLDKLGLGNPIMGETAGFSFNAKEALGRTIELMADGLDKAEAIATALKEIGEKVSKEFTDLVDRAILRATAPEREPAEKSIKELAEKYAATDITNDMVAKGHIRDFVNSHIGEVEQKELLSSAAKNLKSILPDVTEKTLVEAYLREGEFKQPTKESINKELADAKKQLVSIAKLSEDIEDLNGLKEIRQRSFPTERERSQHEAALLSEKQSKLKEISDRNNKIREENKKLETERNRQQKRVSELADKKEQLEKGIRSKKTLSKKADTPEIEALKQQVKDADTKLREAESEAKRIEKEIQDRKDKIAELDANIIRAKNGMDIIKTHKNKSETEIDEEIAKKNRELNKAIKENMPDEKQQKVKLEQVKKATKNKIKELETRIKDGDFSDNTTSPPLKKSDAELIRLKKKESDIQVAFNKLKRKAEESTKSNIERIADFERGVYVSFLIGGGKTFAKIGAMSVMRPFSEAVTKGTLGKVFDAIYPNISKAAMRGGESSSIRSIKAGFGAYFKQMGEKKMEAVFHKSRESYEQAQKTLDDYKNSDNPNAAKLKELENDRNNKLLGAMGNLAYQFIGGSSFQDAARALINRANNIEQMFGGIDAESIKDGNLLDKAGYIINFVGRSHSALKTFSGRFSFAAGFMARLEAAVRDGKELTPDSVLEIGHESYLDFERGKYQQNNAITENWNAMLSALDKGSTKYPQFNKVGKVMKGLLKFDVAITRVPVNILHEAVVEYTAGAFKAILMAAKQTKVAKAEARLEGLLKGSNFENRVKEIVSNMDEKQAATIARCFRKGGIGLGLYAFAAISGLIHFGTYPHLGQRKKKDDDELGKDELNPGQVEVGGHKLGEVASGVIEHIPALWPMFMGTGMAYEYHANIDKGKSTSKAAWDAIYTHLKILEGGIPQAKLITATGAQQQAENAVKKRLEEWGLTETDTGLEGSDASKQFLVDNKIKISTPAKNTIKAKGSKHPSEQLTTEEYLKYLEKRDSQIDKMIKSALSSNYFNNMTIEQKKKEVSLFSEQATEITKEKLFGKKNKTTTEKRASKKLSEKHEKFFKKFK